MPDGAEAPADPAAFVAAALNHLVRGVKDRKSGFHIISVATIAAGLPRLRSVVLRGCAPGAGEIIFHTDARSPKFQELSACPYASVLAYEAGAKLQIRATGQVRLHVDDEFTQRKWAGMSASSRECYRIDCAPGSALRPGVMSAPVVLEEAEAAKNLAICVFKIAELDVLHLKAGGHNRALGRFAGAGLEAHWAAA